MKKFESKGHFCAPLTLQDEIFWLCCSGGAEFTIHVSAICLILNEFINPCRLGGSLVTLQGPNVKDFFLSI